MAAKTKTVKVCGRRSNADSPQSWWVDTAILVNAGNQLTIDATNPGSAIQTWPGSTGWTPTGHPTETNWHATLAYITSQLEVNSFALIGKIGRDGDAFYVGNSLTFTPTVSGTLFLACNDGANFQDNNGFWNVDVTFEENVRLAPTGYGTDTIYADRINTSLVDTWGVILTIQTGFPTPPAWDSTAVANVVAACSIVNSRLQVYAGRSFKEVFGGLELRFYPTLPEVYGVTTNENLIRFGQGTRNTVTRLDQRGFGRINAPSGLDYYPSDYGFYAVDSRGIQNTVIHELGHVLDFRSSSVDSTANDFALKVVKGTSVPPMGTPPYPDATDDIGTFWENSDASPFGERTADHFLNWIRNSYVGIEGKIDDYGEAVTEEQQRASAFWVGGIEFQEDTSPGIEGFSDEATGVAEGAVDLLRSLGTGDPNPTCS